MTDGLGTTRLTTNSGKTVTSTQNMDAFGRDVGSTGSTSSPYGSHGAEGYRADGDAPAGGSNYTKVGARYYDAEWGRFITRDTELSQSPYAYCDGDPVNCTDPSGHLSAVNIASGGMVIDGVSGGAADAPVDTSNDNKINLASTLTAGGANIVADPSSGTLTASQGQGSLTAGNLGTQDGQSASNGTPTLSGDLNVPDGRFTLSGGVTFGGGMFKFNGGLSYDLGKGFSAVVDANGPSLQYSFLQ